VSLKFGWPRQFCEGIPKMALPWIIGLMTLAITALLAGIYCTLLYWCKPKCRQHPRPNPMEGTSLMPIIRPAAQHRRTASIHVPVPRVTFQPIPISKDSAFTTFKPYRRTSLPTPPPLMESSSPPRPCACEVLSLDESSRAGGNMF